MKGSFFAGGKTFADGTHVMAILNLTPDSFYPSSRATQADVVQMAKRAVLEGAEILDLGAQSTRPSATLLSADEELRRILPAVEAVRAATDAVISVDTFYAKVAKECFKLGADMANDVSMLSDEDMATVVADAGRSVCVMHTRRGSAVPDLFEDKFDGLDRALEKLRVAGVEDERVMLDGGIGFNLSKEEDIALLAGYGALCERYDNAILLGASRKSLFGGDVEDRLEATLAATRHATRLGVRFVRVHDVAENLAAIRETESR